VGGWIPESIYDGPRMAQPDEVWNYRRGDGFEKAILLATALAARDPSTPVEITTDAATATVQQGSHRTTWPTSKPLRGKIVITAG
jgi:hypothetical protein